MTQLSCMDNETIEWTRRRAAYTMGIYHKQIGKQMQNYWVASCQKEYEEGYNGVHRPEFEDFNVFVKQGIDLDR